MSILKNHYKLQQDGSVLEKFLNENKTLALISQQTADAIMILDQIKKLIFESFCENMFGLKKKY